MKKLLAAVMFAFLAFPCFAGGIVFIGDSITKGTDYGGVTTADTFAYKIGVANGYAPASIFNAGVGSDTSNGVKNRLQSDVISRNPDVCVVMIGINDWATGVSAQNYSANISEIFDTLRSAGIKVVAITSNLQRGSTAAILGFQPYLQAFENQAAARSIPIIDLYREVADAYLYYTSAQFYALYVDSVHLTKTGHQFVADLASRQRYAGTFVK